MWTAYEEAKAKRLTLHPVTQSQADSLIEKCENAIQEMHRPIYMSQTAESAEISCTLNNQDHQLHRNLDMESYNFIHQTRQADAPEEVEGRISSYNVNTFKGRIYVPAFGRPISFELAPKARTRDAARVITTSLHHNATNQGSVSGSVVHAVVLRNTSKTGHLKRLTVTAISNAPR